MLILAIKMGFDIYELKKRRRLKPIEIEEKLVGAYKSNSTSIKFDYTGNSDVLIYALKHCNSFLKRPKILIEEDKISKILG